MGTRQAPPSPPMGTNVFPMPPTWPTESDPLLVPAAGGLEGTWGPWGCFGSNVTACTDIFFVVVFFFSFCLQDIFIIKVKIPVLLPHISVSLCSGRSPWRWGCRMGLGLCVSCREEERRAHPAQPCCVCWREGRGRQEVKAGMGVMVLVPLGTMREGSSAPRGQGVELGCPGWCAGRLGAGSSPCCE